MELCIFKMEFDCFILVRIFVGVGITYFLDLKLFNIALS